MRAIVQRVSGCRVIVEDQIVGKIGQGLCLLVAAHKNDDETRIRKLADKIVNLRIFNDECGKLNLSLLDLASLGNQIGILAISNFTVYGDTSKSRRPSFIESAPFDEGKHHFESLVAHLRQTGLRIETGQFGADMTVSIENDGPVTVIVEC